MVAAIFGRAANNGANSWDRARLSVVVPISVIVAVAILCIVVAVLSSAERADEISVDGERQMFARALDNYGARILRETESVAGTPTAAQRIIADKDREWMERRLGSWLDASFDHDAVFVVDSAGEITFAHARWRRPDAEWLVLVKQDLKSTLSTLRDGSARTAQRRAAIIQTFLGRPAMIAAVAVDGGNGRAAALSDTPLPLVISVKIIDQDVLSDIETHLRFQNLRQPGATAATESDFVYVLNDYRGQNIARFAWTPRKPGAEIVTNVLPFLAAALGGFALLAAFVLRYMRKTAEALAAGESRLRHLAMHDPLCGLPNRIFFAERLEAVIEDAKFRGPSAAVFYIDLDHFKEVNDTLGHHVGDELIRNVTLRLSHVLRGKDRDNDLVARLGGDEFAVISTVNCTEERIASMSSRLLKALCEPYAINNQTIVIGASIGIALIDRNCAGAADIMRYADMALYRAKNEGRNRACIYDAVMDADLSSRKLLEADLRQAIEDGALTVLYQPLVNASGEKTIGVEALCRWTHPVRGFIPPSEFIPLAEHSGLIIELGEWVLRRACLDGNEWPDDISVAVNVSPLQFRRADFVSMVERVLAETGFDPKRLELEVTESTLLGNVDTAQSAMAKLRAMGVRLALDDFGTGYSSLQYLRKFPFDKIKIDRSFVDNIEKAADSAAIVHAVVGLGRGLGMRVTAEGVETPDQHLFLRAAGVHVMQGYLFGRPMSTEAIAARLLEPVAPRRALAG